MASVLDLIETQEHRLMRSWCRGERNRMKALLARDFQMLVGARESLILDRPSFLEASTERFRCMGYRMDGIHSRQHGRTAFFVARFELEAELDGEDWSGLFLIVDLWRKSRLTRSWSLVERTLSRPEAREQVPQAIRSMQLWR
ncbi:MAG: nuclear transport factor 2 family protein [Sphingomonas sp.]|nr:nuclear transport factor 2 family protein [Sphingomonas sp.]